MSILSSNIILAPTHSFNFPGRFAVLVREQLSGIETVHVPVSESLFESSALMTTVSALSLAMHS